MKLVILGYTTFSNIPKYHIKLIMTSPPWSICFTHYIPLKYIIYMYICIWINYKDLPATSLECEIMVSRGNYLKIALI